MKNFGRDENFMRTLIKSLTLSLGVFAASAANAQLAYYVELGNSLAPKTAATDYSTGIYANVSKKFSDNVKGTVEYSQDITYTQDGKSNLGQTHTYIRVPVTVSNLAWLGGGWKTSITYRWTVPTNLSAQQAGGWGSFLVRPAFSLEGKVWSVNIRPGVSVGLVDRAYQKYVTPGISCTDAVTKKKILCTSKGNTLFAYALEFIPAYKISDKMSLTLSSSISQAFKGGAPGKEAAFATALLGYEFILDIPVSTGPVSYAVSYGNAELPMGKDAKFFKRDNSFATFYVMATF